MKISVKLLKGEMFDIEAESSETVQVLKEKIEKERVELKAERQKLIHAGKVLKDTTTVAEIGIQELDFLVCMVTKELTKPKIASTTSVSTTSIPTSTPEQKNNSAAEAKTNLQISSQEVNSETLANLVAMGFPENESKSALIAAMGNPDLAYEFLLTGIPANVSASAEPVSKSMGSDSVVSIHQLRSHPQFNMLKQLIQNNPASLPQVLSLIGQQNPSLLQAIHSSETEFLTMMNEPITESTSTTPVIVPPAAPSASGAPNTAQMINMLSAMPSNQRAQFAQSMGMSADQLDMFMQMVSQLPPDQLAQMMSGGGHDNAHQPGTIALTHEEMESVNRLMSLGFSQQQAAQAFIACDRNETLAANFLFENGGFDDYDDQDDDMHN